MSTTLKTDTSELLESLRERAAPLFIQAVEAATAHPSTNAPAALVELKRLARTHHAELGFRCMADAFDAIVPSADTLTLSAWSQQRLQVRGFDIEVSARAFRGPDYCAHIEIRSVDRTPLPFTETGYQSLFVPFGELASGTVADYVRELFPDAPIQTALF